MGKLTGKIALVTGGTTGIGRATAELFHAEGAKVIVTGTNPETVEKARTELAGIAEVVRSNAADLNDIKALVAHVKSAHGRIDVLFVNAGVAAFAPAEAVDEAFYDRQFNINVKGAFFLIKEAAGVIPEGGSIIVTSSIAGVSATPAAIVYSATKAAVRSVGRGFAGELAPRKIRVNTISPGPIETPIFGKLGMPQEMIDAFAKNMIEQVPLKRFGKPADIANAALYFASDDSGYVTGAELFVDGGLVEVA